MVLLLVDQCILWRNDTSYSNSVWSAIPES